MSERPISDGTRVGGSVLISSIAVVLSIVLVYSGWTYCSHWSLWWRDNGIQLPGLTQMWLTPMWHMVAAIMVISSAVVILLRRFFVVGLGMWIVSLALYLSFTALVVFISQFDDGSPLGAPPSPKPTHWYWP